MIAGYCTLPEILCLSGLGNYQIDEPDYEPDFCKVLDARQILRPQPVNAIYSRHFDLLQNWLLDLSDDLSQRFAQMQTRRVKKLLDSEFPR